MPRLQVGHWAGVAVTAIVALGNDLDVLYALPLGLMASALATLFSELPNLRIPRLHPIRVRRT